MPISFISASPENWRSVGTCAFHPNLPTAGMRVSRSRTIDTRPAVAGSAAASARATASQPSSGTASTRPRPRSPVVRRCATTVASGGTRSPPNVNDPNIVVALPIPRV